MDVPVLPGLWKEDPHPLSLHVLCVHPVTVPNPLSFFSSSTILSTLYPSSAVSSLTGHHFPRAAAKCTVNRDAVLMYQGSHQSLRCRCGATSALLSTPKPIKAFPSKQAFLQKTAAPCSSSPRCWRVVAILLCSDHAGHPCSLPNTAATKSVCSPLNLTSIGSRNRTFHCYFRDLSNFLLWCKLTVAQDTRTSKHILASYLNSSPPLRIICEPNSYLSYCCTFLTWKTIPRISRMRDQNNRIKAGTQAPQEERYLLKQEEMRLSATLTSWESIPNPLPFTLLSMDAKDAFKRMERKKVCKADCKANCQVI